MADLRIGGDAIEAGHGNIVALAATPPRGVLVDVAWLDQPAGLPVTLFFSPVAVAALERRGA
jgi:hypothetical protein